MNSAYRSDATPPPTQNNGPYLLGIDLGTGGCKSILIDTAGHVVAAAFQEYQTHYPAPGWAEQDPDDWYRALQSTVSECLRTSRIPSRRIVGVGLDAPAHNAVLLGDEDVILRPVILWSDQRSAQQVDRIAQCHGDEIFRLTYQWINPTWTLPQLMWVRENEPELWSKVRRIMIGKDYSRYLLTGVWTTDWIDALSTQLFEAETRKWSADLCNLVGLTAGQLPSVVAPSNIVGTITTRAAQETGLTEGTPVIAGTSDSAVEAFGAGAIADGQGIVKIASAGNVNIMTTRPRPSKQTLTYYHVVDGLWYSVAATNSAASAVRWFRDTFFAEERRSDGANLYEVMDAEAGRIPPGAEGLVFHPYLLGERAPLWDASARASFLGITMRHTRAHFVRAVMEGVAFSLRDCRSLFSGLGMEMIEARMIGGGSKSRLWPQIVADVLDLELSCPRPADAAFGAAMLAGIGVGIFENPQDAVRTCLRPAEVIVPRDEAHRRYDDLYRVYVSARHQLAEISRSIHEITSLGGTAR
jgi:xylulokinase